MDPRGEMTELSPRQLALEVKRKEREVRRLDARHREILAQREREGAVRSRANAGSVVIPRKHWSVLEVLKSLESRGRATKRVAGGYIAGDLSELQKTIILCDHCKHGFDWRKHRYYNVSHYDTIHATGRCDVCKEAGNRLSLYLHEAYVGESWIPRDRLREQRKKATLVG